MPRSAVSSDELLGSFCKVGGDAATLFIPSISLQSLDHRHHHNHLQHYLEQLAQPKLDPYSAATIYGAAVPSYLAVSYVYIMLDLNHGTRNPYSPMLIVRSKIPHQLVWTSRTFQDGKCHSGLRSARMLYCCACSASLCPAMVLTNVKC